ncbi:MAG: glycosyltransferase [Flavobacteriales bacterium]
MKKKLAIIAPSQRPESFIKAHIDRLSEAYTVLFFSGGFLPDRVRVGNRGFKVGRKWFRGLLKGYRVLFGKDRDHPRRAALGRELKKQKIDLVLAEYGPVGAYVADVCDRNNIPLVVHFHGYDAYMDKCLKEFHGPYQRLFSVARAIVAVSRDMKEQLLRIGAPDEKLFVNVYGVDPALFEPHDPSKIWPRAIFWGRMVHKKAPYLTLLAFEQAIREVPEAELTMIGDGPLLQVVRTMVQAKGLEKNVNLPGAIPHKELPQYIQGSRVYVQHSLAAEDGDSEGSPNAILEAFASGLPVVSTLHGGIKDLIDDGVSGFLVAEKDIGAMGKKLVELLKDPEKAKEMGQRGRDSVLNEYSIEERMATLQEILEEADR